MARAEFCPDLLDAANTDTDEFRSPVNAVAQFKFMADGRESSR